VGTRPALATLMDAAAARNPVARIPAARTRAVAMT